MHRTQFRQRVSDRSVALAASCSSGRPTVRPVLAIGDRPVLVHKLLFYKPNLLAHCAPINDYDLFSERRQQKQQINYSIVTKNKPRLYNKEITTYYIPWASKFAASDNNKGQPDSRFHKLGRSPPVEVNRSPPVEVNRPRK